MILVVAEQRDGKLNRATLETVAAAQALAGGDPIKAVVLGQSAGAVAQELADTVSEVLLVEHATLAVYTPDAFASAVQQVVASAKPTYVLFPHTYQTRDFAPVAALRMGGALITDATGINGTGAGATFSPALLDEPSVTIFAARDDVGAFAAGAVATEGDAAIGISNVFAVDGAALTFAEAFAEATAAIAERFPDDPIVGYLSTDRLAAAAAAGFETIGPLRVWLLDDES